MAPAPLFSSVSSAVEPRRIHPSLEYSHHLGIKHLRTPSCLTGKRIFTSSILSSAIFLTTLVRTSAPLNDISSIYPADNPVDNMSQTTCSPRPPKDDNDFDDGIPAKRRKVRKGTRSCWECRQRKMKCTFNQPTDNTCTRCHRRGIKCVSQEYPEEITSSLERNIHMGDRMARVEKLLDKLLGQESPASHKTDHRPKEATREQNNKLVSSVYGSEDSLTTALLKPLAVCDT